MRPEHKRKMLSLLGLAQRAGKLAPGSSRTSGAVKGGKAQGVLICTDLSAKSKKEFRYLCERESVPRRDRRGAVRRDRLPGRGVRRLRSGVCPQHRQQFWEG